MKKIPLNIKENTMNNIQKNINITVHTNSAIWNNITLNKYSSGNFIGNNEVIEIISKTEAILYIGGVL